MSTFFDITKLRFLQESEVDYDSPLSEELKTQIKENNESLFHLGYYTGSSGAATQAPTSEEFWDSNASWSDDDHNGRTLAILSGSAAGKFYTIDDTVASGGKLIMTGDDLSADGVASGDKYKIFFNLQSSAGHNHDATNSPTVILAKGRTSLFSYVFNSTAGWETTSINFTTGLGQGHSNGIGVFIPQDADTLYPIIKIGNTNGNAVGRARIRIGSISSSEVQSTSGVGQWKMPTAGLSCSTMANSTNVLYIEAASTGGTTRTIIHGINIVWGP